MTMRILSLILCEIKGIKVLTPFALEIETAHKFSIRMKTVKEMAMKAPFTDIARPCYMGENTAPLDVTHQERILT